MEQVKAVCGNDDVIKTKNYSKKMEGGGHAKDATMKGVVYVEGCKFCKRCGNPLEV